MVKVVCMIVIVIIVFMLSWLLYCFVSIVVVFKGSYVFNSGEVEIFELMVKVFVIYNFIVYVVMNDRFRGSLIRFIFCKVYFFVVFVRWNMFFWIYCENIEYKDGDNWVIKRRRYVVFVVKLLKKRDLFIGMYVVDIVEVL